MSKAFNRVDHNILIEDLYNMKCPAWLLKTIFSFLSNRVLIFTYQGQHSTPKSLPGGAPQGTLLGVIFFIVKFNSALLRPNMIRHLSFQNGSTKAKYMDDVSLAASVNLWDKDNRIADIQEQLNELEVFVNRNKMKINFSKSKMMKFTRSSKEFLDILSFSDGKNLEEIDHAKLLGLIISSDLKWDLNTDYMCQKARSKIYLLRSMKNCGLNLNELVDAYKKEVRSLLELAVPVWSSGITQEQSLKIERVQKSSLAAILGQQYTSYNEALALTKLEKLETRRTKICLRFTTKNVKSANCLFTFVNKKHNTRSNEGLLQEFQCRKNAFYQSGLPYLARLYNANFKQKCEK